MGEKIICLKPIYYDAFQCLASTCPDTCCRGWVIEIEPEMKEEWQTLTFPENSRMQGASLADYIDTEQWTNQEVRYQMRLNEEMHCYFLNEEKLCDVVCSFSHEQTPKICRSFPRQEICHGSLRSDSLSLRCPAVLDLLWSSDTFSLHCPDAQLSELSPSQALLEHFLSYANHSVVSAPQLLFILFSLLRGLHDWIITESKEQNGKAASNKEYGQEFLSRDMVKKIAHHLSSAKSVCPSKANNHQYFRQMTPKILRRWHDDLYDLMEAFFDSPIFGQECHDLFYASKDFLSLKEREQLKSFQDFLPYLEKWNKELSLLICEELFTSVLTIEIEDIESILVRLQWLILQFVSITYVLFLDWRKAGQLSYEKVRYRISRIFRISERADIMKIHFFDHHFTNWMWSVDFAAELLGTSIFITVEQ